eukprot:1357695-Rhodomonas_salina.1
MELNPRGASDNSVHVVASHMGGLRLGAQVLNSKPGLRTKVSGDVCFTQRTGHVSYLILSPRRLTGATDNFIHSNLIKEFKLEATTLEDEIILGSAENTAQAE